MYQFMMWLWIFDAIINFINFFVGGYDFDKILLASTAGLLAWHNYDEYKRTRKK